MAANALQISNAVHEAINPATALLSADYRLPTGEKIYDTDSSRNIPLLKAANQASQQRTRSGALFGGVMAAVIRMCEEYNLDYTEALSRFSAYGAWNTWGKLVLRAQAKKAGHADAAEALLRPMRGQLILQSLGASWERNAGPRWPDRAATVAGSRSFTVDKDAQPNPGKYFDDQGRYKPPFSSATHGDTPHGNMVAYALGERQPTGQLKDVDAAAKAHLGHGLYDWVTDQERAHLRLLANLGGNGALTTADQDALAWAMASFNDDEATTPIVPVVIGVTSKCKFTLCEKWVGSGSTSMLYGFVWYVDGRPPIPLLDRITWWPQDDHCAWLTADSPQRTSGKSGVGEWDQERGILRCQQHLDGGRYFDVASMSYRSGWAEVPVPGEVLLAVRIDQGGAEVIVGSGVEPPPQQGPKAKMMRRKVGPKPGGLIRFSLKNVSLRSDGAPKDLLEIDGQPRGALKVGRTRYFDFPVGSGVHVARLTAREGDLIDRCKRRMNAG